MNFENILRSERSQSYCDSTDVKRLEEASQKKQRVGLGIQGFSWYEENILKLMVVIVAQLCTKRIVYPAVFPVYHLQAAIFDQTTETRLAENSVIIKC